MIDDSSSKGGSLAHSWHCNIAMMCSDSIKEEQEASDNFILYAHAIGNDAASRFMKLCFVVEIKN